MGIWEWLKNEPATAKAMFQFADGTKIPVRTFGQGLLQMTDLPAREVFADCFGANGPGVQLPGGRAIAANPAVAHMYICALHAASYLVYFRKILEVPVDMLDYVERGLVDSLTQIRGPDGRGFSTVEQQGLRQAIDVFAQNVELDLERMLDTDPKTYVPTGNRATLALIDALDGVYRQGGSLPYLVSSDPNLLPKVLELQRNLDLIPLTIFKLLSDTLKVRLVQTV